MQHNKVHFHQRCTTIHQLIQQHGYLLNLTNLDSLLTIDDSPKLYFFFVIFVLFFIFYFSFFANPQKKNKEKNQKKNFCFGVKTVPPQSDPLVHLILYFKCKKEKRKKTESFLFCCFGYKKKR